MGLETDNPVFSTTIPKRCEVFSSLSARIRRGFGEDFFEVRAPKMQLALRLEFLEIRTGRYIPESWRTATVHSNADNPNNPNLLLFWIRRHLANSFVIGPAVINTHLASATTYHRHQTRGNEPGIGRPRSPCEMRENLRQVERALGEVRKPKCQRMED